MAHSIPRLERFIDGGNFIRFLDRFTDYVELAGKVDRLDLLLLSFVDEITWVNISKVKVEGADRKDLVKVVKHYKDAYLKGEDKRAFQAQFMMIGQESGEGIKEFSRRLDNLASRAFPEENVRKEMKVTAFIRCQG